MEEKLQCSKGGRFFFGGGVRGRGKINEGNTSTDIMYICENTNANLNILYGEGKELRGSRGGGSPSAVCMYVIL